MSRDKLAYRQHRRRRLGCRIFNHRLVRAARRRHADVARAVNYFAHYPCISYIAPARYINNNNNNNNNMSVERRNQPFIVPRSRDVINVTADLLYLQTHPLSSVPLPLCCFTWMYTWEILCLSKHHLFRIFIL